MSKADNMLSILWMLKAEKRVTAKQLAVALEINIRTVYRYIDALCASGVPIVADSGHNGGYSLLHSFNEAPLFFDRDEQKALVHAAIFAKELEVAVADCMTLWIEYQTGNESSIQRRQLDPYGLVNWKNK
jgi:predicted DNA-binding transcriptional regulator YafY